MKKLVIIGASGHGEVIADIAKQNKYHEIVFLDDDEKKKHCAEYPVVGKAEDSKDMEADFVVAIGNDKIRKRVQKMLENNHKTIVSLVHPAAIVAEGVQLGKGTVVMAGAIINPGVTIGEGCIINTAATVDHDCSIGEYVHISVGSHLAGDVTVGDGSWIGIGSSVIQGIEIGKNAVIGAGSSVIRNIPENCTAVGVPCKVIKS